MSDEFTCIKCGKLLEEQPPDFAEGHCHGCWYVSDLPEAKEQRYKDWCEEQRQWEYENHPDYIDEGREA